MRVIDSRGVRRARARADASGLAQFLHVRRARLEYDRESQG